MNNLQITEFIRSHLRGKIPFISIGLKPDIQNKFTNIKITINGSPNQEQNFDNEKLTIDSLTIWLDKVIEKVKK